MRFELARVVLVARKQTDLFETDPPNREEWLRNIFAQTIEFVHRRAEFTYVPIDTPENYEKYIVGKIGRPRMVRENEPPALGLAELEREQWKAVELLIDPVAHSDGQKAAIGTDPSVGRPLALLKSLAAGINASRPAAPYVIEINSIVNAETFWKFVQENPNDITRVTFELYAPNMFGVRNNLDREMRELRDNENVHSALITLHNDDGLALNTDRVKETADYATEGGGNITARTKSGKKYSSKSRSKLITIKSKVPDDAESTPSRLRRLIDTLFRQ